MLGERRGFVGSPVCVCLCGPTNRGDEAQTFVVGRSWSLDPVLLGSIATTARSDRTRNVRVAPFVNRALTCRGGSAEDDVNTTRKR